MTGIPALSVVMPTLNAAATLPRALASLAAQEVDYELIVVDGGSTDATEAVAAPAPHGRWIAAPASSIYQAFNLGVAAARAPVVVFLNADDMLLPGALEAGVAGLAAAPRADILRGRPSFCEDDGSGRLVPVAQIERRAAGALGLDLLLNGPLSINSLFVRRTVFDRVGPFDASYRLAADREWVLRARIAGVSIAEIDRTVYRYVVHAGSSTLDRQRRNYAEIRREHLAIAERYLAVPTPPAIRRALRRWHATETARLGLRLVRQGEGGEAAAVVGRAFSIAPLWPLALSGAIIRRVAGGMCRRLTRPPPG